MLRPGGGTTQRYLEHRSPLGDQEFGGHRRSTKARYGVGDSIGHEHRATGIIDPESARHRCIVAEPDAIRVVDSAVAGDRQPRGRRRLDDG
ncbi:MAG: hypothetical protein EBZ17_12810, partial [Actinobacteria bacterium]|nr:hypothetical protein [Actinomycetota bacterium]